MKGGATAWDALNPHSSAGELVLFLFNALSIGLYPAWAVLKWALRDHSNVEGG